MSESSYYEFRQVPGFYIEMCQKRLTSKVMLVDFKQKVMGSGPEQKKRENFDTFKN